jgi:hypothetical protein
VTAQASIERDSDGEASSWGKARTLARSVLAVVVTVSARGRRLPGASGKIACDGCGRALQLRRAAVTVTARKNDAPSDGVRGASEYLQAW